MKRMKLFDATISPTVLYGSGSWAMTIERKRRLRTTQRKMIRAMNRSRSQHLRSTTEDYIAWITTSTKAAVELMTKYGIQDWVARQAAAQWTWAGRVARLQDGRWTKEVPEWDTVASRKQGRPEKRWIDDINTFLSDKTDEKIDNHTLFKLAQDPTRWSSWQQMFVQQQQLKSCTSEVGAP